MERKASSHQTYFPNPRCSTTAQEWVEYHGSHQISLLIAFPGILPFLHQNLSFSTDTIQVENNCSMHPKGTACVGHWIHEIEKSWNLVGTQSTTHQTFNHCQFAVGCICRSLYPSSGDDIASRYQTSKYPPPSWSRKHCSSQIGWYSIPTSPALHDALIPSIFLFKYLDFGSCQDITLEKTLSFRGTIRCMFASFLSVSLILWSSSLSIDMAPEVLYGEQYDFAADIFSLGCVMFFLCFNKHAFSAGMSSSFPYSLLITFWFCR